MKENKKVETVFDTEGLSNQLELANMGVVDAEVVTPEYDKHPAMKNIPYVKIEDGEENVLNPINGSYPSFFKNRRQSKADWRAATKNPKNNKKGDRVIVTRVGEITFAKTKVCKQDIKANSRPVLDKEFNIVARVKHQEKTIIHNQSK